MERVITTRACVETARENERLRVLLGVLLASISTVKERMCVMLSIAAFH